MRGAGACSAAMLTRTGLCSRRAASSAMAGGMVAEKQRLVAWRQGGGQGQHVLGKIGVEHAVGFIEHELRNAGQVQLATRARSITRPGVPTTMATSASVLACAARAVPPVACSARRPLPRARPRSTPAVWPASSRVGESTRQRTRLLSALSSAPSPCISADRSGAAKAMVLPLPVLARASTSRPAMMGNDRVLDRGRLVQAHTGQCGHHAAIKPHAGKCRFCLAHCCPIARVSPRQRAGH